MNRTYKHDPRHWTNGGTGITNFSPKDLPQYIAAIRYHGDKSFYVSSLPLEGTNWGYSLHCQPFKDTGDFWDDFHWLKDNWVVDGVLLD